MCICCPQATPKFYPAAVEKNRGEKSVLHSCEIKSGSGLETRLHLWWTHSLDSKPWPVAVVCQHNAYTDALWPQTVEDLGRRYWVSSGKRVEVCKHYNNQAHSNTPCTPISGVDKTNTLWHKWWSESYSPLFQETMHTHVTNADEYPPGDQLWPSACGFELSTTKTKSHFE